MTIRIAQVEDVENISRLLNILFAQEADFTPDINKQRHAVSELVQHPEQGHFLLLEQSNKLIGCVSLLYLISTAEGGKVALLEDMVIDPAYRGSGFGKQLLDHAIEFAQQQGCKRITLLTDEDNQIAQHFYARAGFKISAMIPMRRKL